MKNYYHLTMERLERFRPLYEGFRNTGKMDEKLKIFIHEEFHDRMENPANPFVSHFGDAVRSGMTYDRRVLPTEAMVMHEKKVVSWCKPELDRCASQSLPEDEELRQAYEIICRKVFAVMWGIALNAKSRHWRQKKRAGVDYDLVKYRLQRECEGLIRIDRIDQIKSLVQCMDQLDGASGSGVVTGLRYIMMGVFMDMTLKDIAEAEDRSISTVHSQKKKAIIALKAMYENKN